MMQPGRRWVTCLGWRTDPTRVGRGNATVAEPDLFDAALAEARGLYALAESEAGPDVDRVDLAIKAGVTGAFAVIKDPDDR